MWDYDHQQKAENRAHAESAGNAEEDKKSATGIV